MARDNDDIIEVPGLSVSRDDVDQYRHNNRRKNNAMAVPEVQTAELPSGNNKMLLTLMFLLVVGLGLISFYLFQELRVAQTELAENYRRVDQLEKRLSFTDENMNQSGATLQGRLQEMDGEVRKLWDNVWKKTKDRMDKLDASIAKSEAQQKKLTQVLEKLQKDNASDKDALDGLQKRAAELDKVSLMAKSAQASMQTVLNASQKQVSKMTSLEEDVDSLKSRLQSNEDWIRSVNQFRKEVNRDMEALRQQAAPPPPQ
jgi:chromosome segregation ATPase